MADDPKPPSKLAQNTALLSKVELALAKFPDRAPMADAAVAEQTSGKYKSVDELRAAVKGASSTGRGILRSGAQGLLFDFADELAGAGAAVIPGGKGYTQARDEFRAADDAFREENPKTALAASLAGGLLPAVATLGAAAPVTAGRIGARLALNVGAKGTAKALLKEATKRAALKTVEAETPGAIGTLARVVGGGAAAGAVQGAGSAREGSDILPSALIGGALGGALGGTASIAGRVAPKAVRFLRGRTNQKVVDDATLRGLVDTFEDAGGVPLVRTQYSKANKLRPDQVALADINRGGRLGPLGQKADAAIVTAPSLSRTHLPGIEARTTAESARTTADLMKATGVTKGTSNAIAEAEQILKDRALQHSGENGTFEVLGRQHTSVFYPKRGGNMGNNAGRSGWENYSHASTKEGLRLPSLNRDPSLSELQGFEQGLTEEINKLGGGPEKTALIDLKRKFSADVEKSVPAYGKAKAEWRDATKRLEALENGRTAITSPKIEAYHVQQAMDNLPKPEREMFKLGMIHEYLKKTNQVSLNASTAKKIFLDKGSEEAKKLAAIFKTPKDMELFMKKMELEENFHMTRGLGQNSSTQRRVNAGNVLQDDLAEVQAGAMAGVAGGPMAGLMAAVTRLLGRSGTSKGQRALAAETGKRLLTLDHAANLSTIREVEGMGQLMKREAATRLEGAGLGATVGRAPASLLDLDENQRPGNYGAGY